MDGIRYTGLAQINDALCAAHNISLESVREIKQKKHAERGGFEKGIYCSTFQMDANNPDIGYYRAKPQEYPEV